MMELLLKTRHYEAYRYRHSILAISLAEDATDYRPGPSRLPKSTVPDRDENGIVDYYADASEHTMSSWKQNLGEYLWQHIVRKDFREAGVECTSLPLSFLLA